MSGFAKAHYVAAIKFEGLNSPVVDLGETGGIFEAERGNQFRRLRVDPKLLRSVTPEWVARELLKAFQ